MQQTTDIAHADKVQPKLAGRASGDFMGSANYDSTVKITSKPNVQLS